MQSYKTSKPVLSCSAGGLFQYHLVFGLARGTGGCELLPPRGGTVGNRSHSAETFCGYEQDAIKSIICYGHLKDHLEMTTLSNEQFR